MSFVGVGQILCVCVCPSFPFGIEGGIWDVIVLIPNHCLSVNFVDVKKGYIEKDQRVVFCAETKTLASLLKVY